MSIQEKKSIKGTPYAIIKFSDKQAEFELFLFAEILIQNREKLKESESFVLTLQKDKISNDILGIRIASIFRTYNSKGPYCKVAVFLC